MEVTKIHMMLNPTAGEKMFAVMRQIVAEGGPAALFRGLPLIMLRQIPYTCVKLTGYDMMVETIRGAKKMLLEKMKLTDERKIGDDVEVQLLSGVLAGVLAACISQPADVMLSKMCGGTRALSECIIVDGPLAFLKMFQDLGLKGCFEGIYSPQKNHMCISVHVALYVSFACSPPARAHTHTHTHTKTPSHTHSHTTHSLTYIHTHTHTHTHTHKLRY